jgi:tetratricopeptide (TPR) repeat protein
METEASPPPPARTDAAKARKRRIQGSVLALLTVVLCFTSYRAWRMISNVLECERLFVQVDHEMDRSEWQKALATVNQCLALNPMHYPSYEAKAYIQIVTGDKEGARQTLEEGIRHLPEHALLQRALGEFYLKTARDYPRAQIELRKAVALDPTDYTAVALLHEANVEVARKL